MTAMEKNIHDDRLDEFVKKSFDGYSEEPGMDMWDRIEVGLPPEEPGKPLGFTWRGYRWQLAAAIVILLLIARLVCVEKYYQEKLRAATQQNDLTENFSQSNEIAIPPSTTQISSHQPENAEATQLINKNEGSHKALEKSPKIDNVDKGVAQTTNNSDITSMHGNSDKPDIADSQIKTLESIGNSTDKELIENHHQKPIVSNDKTKVSVTPEFSNFQTIANKLSDVEYNHKPVINGVETQPVKVKTGLGWYASLDVMPQLIVEKTITPKRPGGKDSPRQLLASRQESPELSANLSLRIGKQISPRFALETGIGYQRFSRKARHAVGFEYRDGHVIQNPGGAESRNFEYDLNTYSGSATVSLRTEVSGSDVPNDHERLAIIINSEEVLKTLQFPLIGVARLGNGNTRGIIKAGVVGNYLYENTLALTAFALQNNKLRLRNSDGHSVQLSRPKNFVLGYLVSAGVEFRIGRSLSLALSPTLAGDFKRTDPQTGTLPGHTTFGLDMGVNLWF